jgi:hypothetical protein
MRFTVRRLVLGCLFVVAVVGSAAWGYAQGLVATQPVDPVVLSGADIGFRMEGRQGSTPVGVLVVHVDGEWREARFASGVKTVAK